MATDNLRHEAPGRVVDACLLVYASTTDPTRGRGERNESDVRDRLDTDDAGEKNTYRLIKHGGQRMHAALRLGDSQSTRASGVRPSSTSTAQQAAILRPRRGGAGNPPKGAGAGGQGYAVELDPIPTHPNPSHPRPIVACPPVDGGVMGLFGQSAGREVRTRLLAAGPPAVDRATAVARAGSSTDRSAWKPPQTSRKSFRCPPRRSSVGAPAVAAAPRAPAGRCPRAKAWAIGGFRAEERCQPARASVHPSVPLRPPSSLACQCHRATTERALATGAANQERHGCHLRRTGENGLVCKETQAKTPGDEGPLVSARSPNGFGRQGAAAQAAAVDLVGSADQCRRQKAPSAAVSSAGCPPKLIPVSQTVAFFFPKHARRHLCPLLSHRSAATY
ncbi:hypothetical protein Purlil1_4008 [Purpureocillium lilacinum]|uniref:Uncharacterized protein n=1 Tax=Purpureocillium lilacinum TaxID=33203 RepID=A0ABR0C758_PURLI|nr:hypothetical protein Purlil1_4008 [Purpureocillium lilacinum]